MAQHTHTGDKTGKQVVRVSVDLTKPERSAITYLLWTKSFSIYEATVASFLPIK